MVNVCVYCGMILSAESGRSSHKFPQNDIPLMEKWLENMNLGPNFKPGNMSRLCSDHFEEKYYSTIFKGKLLPGSIPTKFGIYKSSCICCHEIKGTNKDRSFRKFPLGNVELLQKWLDAMNLKDVVVTEKSLLCSKHFEEKCFRKIGKNLSVLGLRSDAIPTLFARNEDYEVIQLNDEDIPIEANKRLCSLENVSSPKDFESDFESLLDLTSNPDNYKTPELPTTPQTTIGLNHDHHYYSSPRDLTRRYNEVRQKLKRSMIERKLQNQVIKRLRKKVSSLNDTVRELRRTKAVSEKRLAYLDSITQGDVSQRMSRSLKNRNLYFVL